MPSHIISVISLCWSLECTYISDAGDLDVRNLGALDFNKMGAGNCTGRNDASAITILQAIAIKSRIFLAIPSIFNLPHNGHATALHGVPSSSLFPSTPSIGNITHLTTICSTFPILLDPSPSLLVVSGGPQRQKSSTALTYTFWHFESWEDDVPQALVPYWPCSVDSGSEKGEYVAVYWERAGAIRKSSGTRWWRLDMIVERWQARWRWR